LSDIEIYQQLNVPAILVELPKVLDRGNSCQMSDIARFIIFMVVAAAVFVAVVLVTTRRRVKEPEIWVLLLLAFIVVVLGMLFARYAHIFFQPPWWIYYGFPAVTTFLLPPAVLRMTRREVIQYIPLEC
jgi:uncharacterized membrane protein